MKNWLISQQFHSASQRIPNVQKRNQTCSHQNTLKTKLLLSPLKLHLLKIILRPNFKPSLLHLIKVSRKIIRIDRFKGKKTRNKTCYNYNTLKTECLLSPLKLNIMQITLRPNPKPSFLHLIRVSKTRIIIDIVQRETTNRNRRVFIRTLKTKCLLSPLKLHFLEIALFSKRSPEFA